MSIEFSTPEEKDAFFDRCEKSGRAAAKVVKLLIAGFMEGKYKLGGE